MGTDQQTTRPNRSEDRPSSPRGSGSNWDPETEPEPGVEPGPGADRGAAAGQMEAAGSNWDAKTDPAASDDVERTGEGRTSAEGS